VRNGFFRVACVVPETAPLDCRGNAEVLARCAAAAAEAEAGLVLFPELSLTGYSCGDMFHGGYLADAALDALLLLRDATRDLSLAVVAGLPLRVDDGLYNCAAVLQSGHVLGLVPKSYLPEYAEYHEPRWFRRARDAGRTAVRIGGDPVPFGAGLLFEDAEAGAVFGVEICEDLWAPLPPSAGMALDGATLLLNLSASSEQVGKADYRRKLVESHSGALSAAYAYVSSGPLESTADVVFGSHVLVAENGHLLAEAGPLSSPGDSVPVPGGRMTVVDLDLLRMRRERARLTVFGDCAADRVRDRQGPGPRRVAFSASGGPGTPADVRHPTDPSPFVPSDPGQVAARCRDVFAIQVAGLARRLRAAAPSASPAAIVALSGGVDSALALLVAEGAFRAIGRPVADLLALTMPGPGTTGRTRGNAGSLADALGIPLREISIAAAVTAHLDDIGHDGTLDVTYENAQARERTQIAMDLANRSGALVIGTADLSELCLGFTTYNGDHMSMYGVNAGVPKSLVRPILATLAEDRPEIRDTLSDILATPISPELLPPGPDGTIRQQTEHIVGSYDWNDFFLYHFLRWGEPPDRILFLARRAFPDIAPDALAEALENFLGRFFRNQFKRSCLPEGPKVGSVSVSPRGDLRLPGDLDGTPFRDAVGRKSAGPGSEGPDGPA